jgi:Ca-activated chloride channel homolog
VSLPRFARWCNAGALARWCRAGALAPASGGSPRLKPARYTTLKGALADGVLLCLITVSSVRALTQGPTFASKVEAVRVDVLVTEQGRPVRDLHADEFEVLDNGVRQEVDLVSFEQVPLNAILVLDMSASVAGERLDHLRAAARGLLDGLKAEDQAALVTFSHVVFQGSDLTTNLERVRAAIDRTFAPGETSLVDGIHTGMMLGEADAGRSLLIVFSDGFDTASWLSADSVLDTAKRADVVVYAVAVGTSPKATFLRDLSALTGGTFFRVESTRNLGATFLGILDEFRYRYLVSYSPRDVVKGGWHKLEVRVKRKGVTVKARPGYLAN